MNDSKQQQDEISRDEQWLAGVCERSAEIDAAPLKRTIRIAIEEQWLARKLEMDTPVGLSGRVRRVVREAVTARRSTGESGRRRGYRTWAWIGGGLSAAAAITLSVVAPWRAAYPTGGDDATTGLVTAFEGVKDENEDLDTELVRLREALSELDQNVVHAWSDEPWDESLDEASDLTEDGV